MEKSDDEKTRSFAYEGDNEHRSSNSNCSKCRVRATRRASSGLPRPRYCVS
jgi:hypothetical protein